MSEENEIEAQVSIPMDTPYSTTTRVAERQHGWDMEQQPPTYTRDLKVNPDYVAWVSARVKWQSEQEERKSRDETERQRLEAERLKAVRVRGSSATGEGLVKVKTKDGGKMYVPRVKMKALSDEQKAKAQKRNLARKRYEAKKEQGLDPVGSWKQDDTRRASNREHDTKG